VPYKRSEEEFVSAVMSANLLTASADDALTEAARRMAERRVGETFQAFAKRKSDEELISIGTGQPVAAGPA